MGGFAGIGTKFQYWNESSSAGTDAWVDIAEIKNISGPSTSKEQYDTTTMDTTGGYRTFVPGLRDGGEITATMNFTNAAYKSMAEWFDSTDVLFYRIVFPDTGSTVNSDTHTKVVFQGFVTGIPITAPTDDIVSSDVTIKVSGPPYVDPTWDPDDSTAPAAA